MKKYTRISIVFMLVFFACSQPEIPQPQKTSGVSLRKQTEVLWLEESMSWAGLHKTDAWNRLSNQNK